jgi:preprotein translocase subunit SecE
VRCSRDGGIHYRIGRAMNENFSLIVMCVFLVATILFLADQILSYH